MKSKLSEAAGFNSVDLRIVLLPLFTKSISSLCPPSSPTCPTPNEGYSTQLCRSFPGATFTISIGSITPRCPNGMSDIGEPRQA